MEDRRSRSSKYQSGKVAVAAEKTAVANSASWTSTLGDWVAEKRCQGLYLDRLSGTLYPGMRPGQSRRHLEHFQISSLSMSFGYLPVVTI